MSAHGIDSRIAEAQLEHATALAAYIVSRHGGAYAPIFERLERELAEARKRSDPVERARRYLTMNSLNTESAYPMKEQALRKL